MKESEIEFKYIGNGAFVPGVPARDLKVGEADSRGILKLVELSPLYEKAPAPKKEKSEKGDK